jgi:hypothetical protein
MHRDVMIAGIAAAVLWSIVVCHSVRAERQSSSPSVSSSPVYDPYPPGILPSDLDSEIVRVQNEIRTIFSQAIAEWHALSPPKSPGNPPTRQGSGYEEMETLGKLLNFDLNISPFRNQACAFCHMPYAGFSGPVQSVNLTMVAYPGTVHYRAGKRTAQRYTYSPDFPVLEYNSAQAAFFGGNFFDGHSTGYLLQSADAEQAQHPPVDTQEMGFPDKACIAYRLSTAVYRPLFERVWGSSFNIKWPSDTEQICDTPGGAKVFGISAMPVSLRPEDRTKANDIFDHWGQSISKYERSMRVSAFLVEVRRLSGGQVQNDGRRAGGLPTVQRQRQLQFLPSRRIVDDPEIEPDRYGRSRGDEAFVHLLRLCQSGPTY